MIDRVCVSLSRCGWNIESPKALPTNDRDSPLLELATDQDRSQEIRDPITRVLDWQPSEGTVELSLIPCSLIPVVIGGQVALSSSGPLAREETNSHSPALHENTTKGLTTEDDGGDVAVDISRTNNQGDAMDHRFKRFVSPNLVSTLLTGQVIII